MTTQPVKNSTSVSVACCQILLRVAELDYNRTQITKMIKRACQDGAKIIVLPELANSGYQFNSFQEAKASSERTTGTTIKTWIQLAEYYSVTIIGGLCESAGDGKLYNSVAIVDETGLRTVYRKVHLWDREKTIFTPGTEPPQVIQSAGYKLATLICYDIDFAEWVRGSAVNGADLLCAPVNWPNYGQVRGEQPMELIRARTAASVNHLYIAVCDRAGAERGTPWIGGSSIIDPEGWILSRAYGSEDECIITADCDLQTSADKRISDHNHVLQDRMPALYERAASDIAHPKIGH